MNTTNWGIGNPLNQLIYTSGEIEEMKKRGEIFDPHTPESQKEMRRMAQLRKGNKKIRSDKYMMRYRLGRAAKLWCQWNRRQLDASDFAYKFGELFKDECLMEWNESHKITKRTYNKKVKDY